MPQFNSPLSIEKAHRLVHVLNLDSDSVVLDVGCGEGEFLIRLIEATGASGVGIDVDPACITVAKQSAAERLSADLYEFRLGDIQAERIVPESFDVAICIGSSYAFGEGREAYPKAIDALTQFLRPGGQILIGECYWKKTPDPAYLQTIGDPVGVYNDHRENVALPEAQGLIPTYAAVASEDEWDDFEWRHSRRIEASAAKNPDDPAAAARLHENRKWRNAYLQWGRSTMGFGFYVFRK